jgi:flagellar hook protein FlgE
MGLSSALFAGISGLERFQTSLDVIGNNVANVNTYGYKSQRVLFEDLLYDTIQSGTAPAGNNAGTNPSQLGAGVDISVIDTDFSDGELETTGIASDLAIEGNGFFVLSNNGEQVYSRNGAFNLSASRELVNASGMVVQGWNQTRDNAGNSTINTGGAISDVLIPVGDNRIAKSTTEVTLNGNLNNAGDIASTGTIFNSQRLFVSETGDTEVSSGAVDLSGIFIKDPAGGVDNVHLFQGSGSDSNNNAVLASGDQITVQLNKGGRPLEAIFVYGKGDLVNNVTGDLGLDGTPDAGLESYDGTTLNDFLSWFDQAFGLIQIEDQGATADSNGAHGVDGDNPNDLVDMGKDSTTPFTDETDGSGFDLAVTKKIETLSGNTALTDPTGPKVGYIGGTAEFNVLAGGNSDVTVGSSFVDVDEDGAYNSDKDIILEGVESYVVTGNNTVTLGAAPNGSNNQLLLRSVTTEQGPILDGSDMYIDLVGDGSFNAGTDIVVKGAFSTDVFGGAMTSTAASFAEVGGKATLTFDLTVGNNTAMNATTVTAGMSVYDAATPTRFFVESVDTSTAGTMVVTFDRADNGAGFIDTLDTGAAGVTFMGAALVQAGYTATSSSGTGSTLLSNLNSPLATRHPTTNKLLGKTIFNTVADNEKGMAGSTFVDGDVTARVSDAPVATTVVLGTDGTSGNATLTVGDATGIKTGMTIVGDNGTKFTVDRIVGTTVHLDQAPGTEAFADGFAVFSGFAYLDADNDATNSESVFRVKNTSVDDSSLTSGDLFIDVAYDGVATTSGQLTITASTPIQDLSSYEDNAIIYTDTSTGNVYRKVPVAYNADHNLVYLDAMNTGTYDEVRYNVVASEPTGDPVAALADYSTDGRVHWMIDEDFDGVAGSEETILVSNNAIETMSTGTASIQAPTANTINGVRAQSGSVMIRGQIGTVNELSDISFISGTNSVERMIFGASSLADSSGNGFSLEVSATGESVTQNIVVYDSLGASHDVNITFVLEDQDNDTASWRWFAETADASRADGIFPVGDPRGLTPAVNVGTGVVHFDNFGRYLRSEPTQPLISIPIEGQDTDSALNITPDFSILTAFANTNGSEVDVRDQDGYAQGVMDRFTVNADGSVTGIYTNGLTEVVAQVALAAFANPDGLTRAGSSLFTVGSNSGNAMIGAALTGERGAIRGESLELSNVDITQEFTDMIVTQRAYQANARVVTKSDELLQELMSIIR